MPDLVVVGSMNVDLVVITESSLPKPGETVFGSSKATYFGGKGANQAVSCARLGGKVRMIGAVGSDDDGKRILRALEAEAIDTRTVLQRGDQSGFASVTVSGTGGENTVSIRSASVPFSIL
jgi:ribokinase